MEGAEQGITDPSGGYPLSREFLEQYEINSRQLDDLLRAKRFTTTRILFSVALLLSSCVVIGLAVWFSPQYVSSSITNRTLGPLYDFGVALIAIFVLLFLLSLMLYGLVLTTLNAIETRRRLKALIIRQFDLVSEMSPYIDGEPYG